MMPRCFRAYCMQLFTLLLLAVLMSLCKGNGEVSARTRVIADPKSETAFTDDSVRMTANATMNDSTLTLSIEVLNVSDAEVAFCPSFVEIRPGGASIVMFAAFGLGSSFDLEPIGQMTKAPLLREPFPQPFKQLEVQFVRVKPLESCIVQYVYKHGLSKRSCDSTQWYLFGEFALPAWSSKDRKSWNVITREYSITGRRSILMKRVELPYYNSEAWWKIVDDTVSAHLSWDEQTLLSSHQLPGRQLLNPHLPVVLEPGR